MSDFRTSIFDVPFLFRQPVAVDAETIIGVSGTKPYRSFVSISRDGQIQEQSELEKPFELLVGVVDQHIWTTSKNTLTQYSVSGEPVKDIELQIDSGLTSIGSAACAGKNLLLNLDRHQRHEQYGLGGELVLLGTDGTILWGSVLPVDRIQFAGCVEANTKNHFQPEPKPAWLPRTWVSTQGPATFVSGKFVYASWSEFPRTGIGKHYVVEASSGHPVVVTRPYPVSQAFNMGDGRALISACGYAPPQTQLLDPATDRLTSWPTHGRFFRSADGSHLFCVEMKSPNTPDQHVVRLNEDGSMEKFEPAISGFRTSVPQALSDHQFCFWKGDQVWVFDTRDGSLNSIAQTEFGELAWANSVRFPDKCVAIFAYRNAKGESPAASKMILIKSRQ